MNPSCSNAQGKIENLISKSHNHGEICKTTVDGAWTRYRQQLPRAGIGWTASIAGNQVFAGNAKVMTLSFVQTEAYAMY